MSYQFPIPPGSLTSIPAQSQLIKETTGLGSIIQAFHRSAFGWEKVVI